MHKIINSCLILAVLITGFALYSLELITRDLERQQFKVKADIASERETIRLLEAEWASLTKPERLQKLVGQHLKLKFIGIEQIARENELISNLPERVQVPIISTPVEDPIGAILKEMQ